ncbi:MAG TPA: 3-phosphoshikimate 1-carboxyvinyltransferase [Opitutaceae bacterium]|nr:3-phosphoshikimate 1-carboxyvinyltransferase [Opitutaceae bacterium]
MSLPDLLPIEPFTRPATGEVSLPGSKSLTNRALLLAALGDRPVTLTGALFSEDTHLMSDALRRLGFAVEADAAARTITVGDQPAGFRTDADIFVGLAGTAARFLTALCAAAPSGTYRIDGVPQMRKRPMRGLIEALRQLGADIRCLGVEGFFPLEVRARGLRGGEATIDASESSQMLSALLMVAPRARDAVVVRLATRVREPFVEMTVRLMEQFGVTVGDAIVGGARVGYRVPTARYVAPSREREASYAIEPDATAASYYLALPAAAGGSLRLAHLTSESLQGDVSFADVLREVGLAIERQPGAVVSTRPAGATLRGVTRDFSGFSDTFLTLAALSPLLSGPTRISGIAHTRKQETDRVAGMARELTRLGQRVVETDDALEIHPQPLCADQTIETYGDHRFAMSFGILGCADLHGNGRPWLTIRNPACCAKTFPDFFELLDAVRKKSLTT